MSAVLKSLRLRGTIFSRAELAAPWAVRTRGFQDGQGLFHAVLRGGGFLLRDDDAPIALSAGEVVVLPFGDAHSLCDAPQTKPKHISKLPHERRGAVNVLTVHGGGAETVLLCGSFSFERRGAAPLFSSLPRALVVRPRGAGASEWLMTTLRFLAQEIEDDAPGAAAVTARLTEVVVVQALRAAVESSAMPVGWLRGLGDPRVAQALGAIHTRPTDPWTAESLARLSGMSRSSFFETFAALVGEPPAKYLARWRMQVAANALIDDASVAEAAAQAGYASDAAFVRAFQRTMGLSPAEYRRSQSAIAR